MFYLNERVVKMKVKTVCLNDVHLLKSNLGCELAHCRLYVAVLRVDFFDTSNLHLIMRLHCVESSC